MKKIMIIEDNAINMQLFSDILEASNYQVVKINDSRLALDEIKKEQSDLILTDIQMPFISGLELTKLIKADKETQHIPVVAITAFAMKGDEENILAAGCDSYISKPISIQPFLETVKKFTV